MTSKASAILVLAAFCVMSPASVALARGSYAPSIKRGSGQIAGAHIKKSKQTYPWAAPRSAPGVPDFAVQYGYVANPAMASGSFGAMLQGKNPAAGAIP